MIATAIADYESDMSPPISEIIQSDDSYSPFLKTTTKLKSNCSPTSWPQTLMRLRNNYSHIPIAGAASLVCLIPR